MEYLQQLIQLRQQIRQLEDKMKAVQELAVMEALDLLQQQQTSTQGKPNKMALDNSEARVIVAFKTRFVPDRDDTQLSRLADDLNLKRSQLMEKKRSQLQSITLEEQKLQEQLNQLNAKRDKLLNPKSLKLLKIRYEQRRQELSYQEPQLRIQLKE
ncbi:hypothetical protein PN462_21110 [Spirulina sp. CS-785/01]|uniref:hypothetical protein n=1 Tax=Spirulina sp. CS-785/01 TaxID=3021716 RepID=UPI00232B0797|nr:hypothetical protein [Spirulina sp. CS-785/01]MDB9315626.1 hypothetical protein [Spirulina sp. CS-785/01]